MDFQDRDRVMAERRKAMMESDFDPRHTPEKTPATDVRVAVALEYIAYQLGQINRKMDAMIALQDEAAAKSD